MSGDFVDQFLQLTVVALRNGAFYGLMGVGFALIIGVTGRFHYAYGVLYALVPYLVVSLTGDGRLVFAAAVIVALAVAACAAVAIEVVIYRPVAARAGAQDLLGVFIASLGLAIVGENVIRAVYGPSAQQIDAIDLRVFHLGPATFTNLAVFSSVSALVLVVALAAVLRWTGFGRSVKATRSNPQMAEIVGVNTRGVVLACFAIGTIFAGVAALWRGMEFAIEPDMGAEPVIIAFVVAFLGGTSRSPIRVFLVGCAISLVEQYSSLWLSARWSQLAIYVVLVAYVIHLSFDLGWLKAMGRRHVRSTRPEGV